MSYSFIINHNKGIGNAPAHIHLNPASRCGYQPDPISDERLKGTVDWFLIRLRIFMAGASRHDHKYIQDAQRWPRSSFCP